MCGIRDDQILSSLPDSELSHVSGTASEVSALSIILLSNTFRGDPLTAGSIEVYAFFNNTGNVVEFCIPACILIDGEIEC